MRIFIKYFSKLIILVIIFEIITLQPITNIFASENPLNYQNNKYGIHIIDENDLEDAAQIVNSGGGEWGYITIVIREDERINIRWQNVFNKIRRLHLIPIVRIASRQEDGGWKKLDQNDIDNWISFFNSLNWVIQNRYIIVGNEPNHTSEWGGEVNPEEYAAYLYNFSKKLKTNFNDYFILPAALDSAATNTKLTMSSDVYLKKMIDSNKDVFEFIDGWNSHSYPNIVKNQIGTTDGKYSVNTYKWELNYLKELGVSKDLPVFITETGWKHNNDGENDANLSLQQISEEIKSTNENVWKDENIVAVTPFILSYQSSPFSVFSWKKPGGNFYDFVQIYQNIPKKKGNPAQIVNVNLITFILPPVFYNNGEFIGVVLIKNTGQSIFNGTEKIYRSRKYFNYTIEPKVIKSEIEPFRNSFALVKIRLHLK